MWKEGPTALSQTCKMLQKFTNNYLCLPKYHYSEHKGTILPNAFFPIHTGQAVHSLTVYSINKFIPALSGDITIDL